MKVPLSNYPGYFIDEDGNVYNSRNNILRGGRSLKYKTVTFTVNGNRYTKYVHKLVLETFIGPCPEDCQAAHNDGNPQNNSLSNLRWATKSENQLDRIIHGTHSRGIKNPRAKLSAEDVHEIRKSNLGKSKLALKYNVSKSTIRDIIDNRIWRHDAISSN